MNHLLTKSVEQELLQRRDALLETMAQVGEARDLARLLDEVQQALGRFGTQTFGRCEVCLDSISDEQLSRQPMSRYCLCRLSVEQQNALQRDLDLAWQIQSSLLPPPFVEAPPWSVHYRYIPAGPVSGDYCDVIQPSSDSPWLYFLVGDVSGKGVAAAYVMAHLSALVRRTLDQQAIPVDELVKTVNRHLSERTPETHFVTLVCGRAHVSGQVEICNAGHCLPLVTSPGRVESICSTGLPLAISEPADYDTRSLELKPEQSIVLYTDGFSEARDSNQQMFGDLAMSDLISKHALELPTKLASRCLEAVGAFRGDADQSDDMTMMVIRRGS